MIKTLAVLGPLLAAIGAAFLIYDMLRAPLRLTLLSDFPRARIRIENDYHDRKMAKLKELSPPYTKEELDAVIAEEIERHKKAIRAEEDSAAREDYKEREYSFRVAIRGIVLVLIGSLMQSLSAYLS